MILTLDYDNKQATTHKTIAQTIEQLDTLLFKGAFSDNINELHIIKHSFITSKILKACKICLMRGIVPYINGKAILDWDGLGEYQNTIDEFIEAQEQNVLRADVMSLIMREPELIKAFSHNSLDEFLDTYLSVNGKGYDLSMSSASYIDTPSHGKFKNTEWSRTHQKKLTVYNTQLQDKLNMYINLKFYIEHDIERDTHPHGVTELPQLDDIVVPVSACSEYTQMLFN